MSAINPVFSTVQLYRFTVVWDIPDYACLLQGTEISSDQQFFNFGISLVVLLVQIIQQFTSYSSDCVS